MVVTGGSDRRFQSFEFIFFGYLFVTFLFCSSFLGSCPQREFSVRCLSSSKTTADQNYKNGLSLYPPSIRRSPPRHHVRKKGHIRCRNLHPPRRNLTRNQERWVDAEHRLESRNRSRSTRQRGREVKKREKKRIESCTEHRSDQFLFSNQRHKYSSFLPKNH